MLPAVVPKARIMRYGYNSYWYGDHAVRTSLSNIANGMLLDLKLERQVSLSIAGDIASQEGDVVLRVCPNRSAPSVPSSLSVTASEASSCRR